MVDDVVIHRSTASYSHMKLGMLSETSKYLNNLFSVYHIYI